MPANIANHLWQSTLFAAAIALLTLTLRRNHAHARHWLWMIASVKFLVPFALVAVIGSRLIPAVAPSLAVSNAVTAVETLGEPFVTLDLGSPAPTSPSALPIASLLYVVWACGFVLISASWARRWMRIRAAVHLASPLDIGAGVGVRVASSSASIEPGVFGIWRPVLVLPHGIADRLTPEQLQAIVAHELCHIRRRDNLAAAIHMSVQAIFWFHPLVWWIGARLIEERERACDEEVLRLGNDPEVYAESILRACRFYLESPLACVSGVTGADLKQRIEDIMTHRIAQKLTYGRKLLLTAAGIAAIAAPIAYGVLNAPILRAQEPTAALIPKVEVATVKPSKSGERGYSIIPQPGGRLRAINTSLKQLLLAAYHLHEVQLAGGPDWLDRDRFNIEAKAEGQANLSEPQLYAMLGGLITERFQLKTHRETKSMPYYSLLRAKTGPKLKPSDEADEPSIRNRRIITAKGGTMPELADILGWVMGRPVIDATSLPGIYEYRLEWTPDESQIQSEPAATAPEFAGPHAQSIFTAIQEQLGLKLEAGKGPVQILVIDHAEKPSQN
jgi:bla regulator protein BlaR1